MACKPEVIHAAGFVGRAAAAGRAERLEAIRLVTTGEVIELSHKLQPHAPHYAGIQPPFLMNLWTSAHGVIRALRRKGAVINDAGVNLEHVSMTLHTGTHIDALGHFSAGQRMYGDRTIDTTVGDLGLYELGAEAIPVVVARGVLLDVACMEGGSHLEAGRVVTRAMLSKAEADGGLKVGRGDVVLIRTGWGRYYSSDPARYVKGEPGIDLGAAQYLTDAGVAVIGSDNMAIEVMPCLDPAVSMPVHQHTLVDCGVYLVENMALDELAEKGSRPFCFVMLAIRFKGATASPTRPVAIL